MSTQIVSGQKHQPFNSECFRQTLDQSTDAIGMLDLESGRYWENRAFLKLFGPMGDRDIADLFADKQVPGGLLGSVMKGKMWEDTVQMYAVDGSERDISLRAYCVKDDEGTLTTVVGIHTDITEKTRVSESLKEKTGYLNTILTTLPDQLFIMSNDGVFLDVISENEENLYLSKEQFIGKHFSEILPDPLSAKLKKMVSRTLTGEPVKPLKYTLPIRAADHHYEGRFKRVDEDRVLFLVRDISEQKRAEWALLEQHQLLQNLTREIPGVVYQYQVFPDGRHCFPYVSEQSLQIFEMDPEEVKLDASSVFSRIHPDDMEEVMKGIQHSHKTLTNWSADIRFILPEMGERWHRGVANPVKQPDESVIWYGYLYDVTERKNIEASLEESEQRFRKLFERAEAISVQGYNVNREVIYWNDASEVLYGYSRSEALGRKLEDLIIPVPMREGVIQGVKNWYENDVEIPPGELELVRADGKPVTVYSSHVKLINSRSGEPEMYCIDIDLTDRKRAENQIRYASRAQQLISDVSTEFISVESENLGREMERLLQRIGEFLKVDRCVIFDFFRKGGVHQNSHVWRAATEFKAVTPKRVRSVADIETWYPWMTDTLLKDGMIRIGNVADLPAEAAAEKQTWSENEIQSLILLPVRIQGETVAFLSIESIREKRVWTDYEADLLRVLANILSEAMQKVKSERNMMELNRNLEETTALANSMAAEAQAASSAKSEFLAKMSHEIRTPLNGVIGFTELLMKTPLSPLQKEHAENAITSGQSLLSIINDILDFSKIEAGKMELDPVKTDLFQLMEKTADIMKYHASEKSLELLLNIDPVMPRYAMVDPVRLKQILINLLGNAIKFTEKGEVELSVTCSEADDNECEFRFSVRDTGIGISGKQQTRLFQAFAQADNSTTRKYGGTGLGLVISNRLAAKMGSKIEIESEPGKGSEFFMKIRTESMHGESLPEKEKLTLKRVLVVDDNANNRSILEHNFSYWGIEFVGCEDGLRAMKIIEESAPFDLLIIDYQMPYINGLDTIRMIREKLEMGPEELPVMIMHSSSDDEIIREKGFELGVAVNLVKPVKARELHRILQNIENPESLNEEAGPVAEDSETTKLTRLEASRILIAEDVKLNMILVKSLIREILPNAEILEAESGTRALEVLANEQIDLVLMDVHMPEMDGLEATHRIRISEEGTNQRIPIVALTAAAMNEDKEQCLDAGMDGFLSKPIDVHSLQEVLITYLSVKRNGREPLHKKENEPSMVSFGKEELLGRIQHDMCLYKQILESMLELEEQVGKLGRSVIEGDFSSIKTAAHTLKGMALNMSFTRMGAFSKTMEELAESNAAGDEMEVHFQAIVSEWETIEQIIERELLVLEE
ncbi:MAG: response regulator [Balneolaceae bacterium]|nr:MAG: response regulator [Balneolaceae bacterium]